MESSDLSGKDVELLAQAMEQLPVGITLTDPEGCMLYYNAYCTRYVDRKPEYIGRDVRTCHLKPGSVDKINIIFAEMKAGQRDEFYYEAMRGGHRLGVTIVPLRRADRVIGFIHSFVVIR